MPYVSMRDWGPAERRKKEEVQEQHSKHLRPRVRAYYPRLRPSCQENYSALPRRTRRLRGELVLGQNSTAE